MLGVGKENLCASCWLCLQRYKRKQLRAHQRFHLIQPGELQGLRPVTSPETSACDAQRPSLLNAAPEAKRKWTRTRLRTRSPFLAVAGSHEFWPAGTMSYDYHQNWGRDGGGRDGGSRSSGGGYGGSYGGGHGGNRGSGGGGGGGGGGGRGGRGRHPGHLKGREIGLWYAKKQGQKNKEAERQEVIWDSVVEGDETGQVFFSILRPLTFSFLFGFLTGACALWSASVEASSSGY